MDTSDKSTNKAMSAALKYAIIQALSIPTEELIDSERDHLEPQAQYITTDQAIQINDLIKETGSKLDGFLKYIKAESVETILASDYQKAIIALNKKKQRQPGDETAWQTSLCGVHI